MKSQPKTPLERDLEKTRQTGEFRWFEPGKVLFKYSDGNYYRGYTDEVIGTAEVIHILQDHLKTTVESILDEIDGANNNIPGVSNPFYIEPDIFYPESEAVAEKITELRSRYQLTEHHE